MAEALPLAGRNALVTGASRGIGRAIALTFASAGADVAITARSAEKLAEVAAEIDAIGRRAVIIPADVVADGAPADIVEQAVGGLGGLHVLVNNAGGNSFMSPLKDMRQSGWDKVMSLNLSSVMLLTQAALPALIASGNGSVINVSSVAGYHSSPLMAHYGAAKAAVLSLTRSLSVEVAHAGVRVNSLVPGWIDTDLTDFLRQGEVAEKGLLSRVPMGRWGTAQEIADGALFLASDASSFMTGQALVMDGGLTVA